MARTILMVFEADGCILPVGESSSHLNDKSDKLRLVMKHDGWLGNRMIE